MAALVAAVVWVATGVATASAADRLPDLGMARLSDFRVEKTAGGRTLLRYTTIAVNVGKGRFELRGARTSTTQTQMTVSQRVYNDTGGSRLVSTPAVMVFGGDGHNHWHVRDLETSELIRLDNGSKVGTGVKRGFCFFDNTRYRLTLPGAPQSPVYTGCGSSSSLVVNMGLSVGWGDVYPSTLPDQYIDITGLTAGRYRLRVTADSQNRFLETSNSNNATWVDLQLKGNMRPRVIAYGPSA